MRPPRSIRRDANAKINVFLRVLSAREDGYHDLESLVVPISLADRVTVTPDDALHVETTGVSELAADVPSGGLNLALVAALALADACPDAGGARVHIDKRIPVAAGLGGGSADAAAALLALNELWGCELDLGTLAAVAERVGSDVPAMLAGGAILMSGRGELLAPAEVPSLWWVVVDLGFGVRSPDAYRWWDEDGEAPGPDPQPLLDAAAAGDARALGPLLFNDLEAPVVRRHPEIGTAKARLLAAGSLGAVMTGSGSAVVALARDRGHAEGIAGSFESAFVASGPPVEQG
ncbi:MAG: 4-(cytidine 5'-diphospho)-2-C-methyl-D-erythritol kinase [Actinomycetota bacterium]